MACEDSGLRVALKPGELKIESLWKDRRALCSPERRKKEEVRMEFVRRAI
jgi:hypothetical protein